MTIDFMSKRLYAAVLSVVVLVASIVSFSFMGLNLGLDFTGGALVEMGFAEPITPDEVRPVLVEAGYGNAVVQNFGTDRDILIRIPPVAGTDQSKIGDQIRSVLDERFGNVALRRSEFVGPAVGDELREDGGLAMLVALIMVMIYIMFRFTGKFSVGAVVALVHDVFVVIGVFTMLQWTFNLPELAALLAVIGYSLNDTIVVSDRIRENFQTARRGTPIELINRSLNQTLGRTLVTSLTTLLVLASLLVAGGEQIAGFARALTIGVIVGTYSSIYVAASVLLALNVAREDLALPDKDESKEVV